VNDECGDTSARFGSDSIRERPAVIPPPFIDFGEIDDDGSRSGLPVRAGSKSIA
jgi:hypothetical protein